MLIFHCSTLLPTPIFEKVLAPCVEFENVPEPEITDQLPVPMDGELP